MDECAKASEAQNLSVSQNAVPDGGPVEPSNVAGASGNSPSRRLKSIVTRVEVTSRLNARITFRADQACTYRIEATTFNAGVGHFTLKVRKSAERQKELTDARPPNGRNDHKAN
jgi:hypothetical protein